MGWANIQKLHDKYVSEGFEGIVIRDPAKVYNFGGRTVDDNRMNVPSPSELVEDAKEIQGMLDELDYVLDNCTLMEKKQETDIELEEEMEDIEK